ncbi:MAG: lipoyl(octanoyl) transferase LipB [Alphaproteobacteria bacterium]
MPRLAWSHLGRIDYEAARSLQERLASARREGAIEDLILTLEHPPVVTIGRNAPDPFAGRPVAEGAPPRLRVDRGGAATWHGPGQLVIYPVVALRSGGRGVRQFVLDLEEALCAVARDLGVSAVRRQGLPGAWVEGVAPRKLGSVGIAVRRGVSLHGASLNVTRGSARGFDGFDPCGLPGVVATSLEDEAPGLGASVEQVAEAYVARWAGIAGRGDVHRVGAAELGGTRMPRAGDFAGGDEVSTWT